MATASTVASREVPVSREAAENRVSLETLTAVNQTLFNPVYARALESARKDGIVVDPYAQRIIREAGYDCGKFAGNKYNHIGSAVRTRLFDRIAAAFLQDNPSGTVVILGCGLDARPYRMDNGLATWISLDLPEVMPLRERFFAPDKRRRHVALSALDSVWFDWIPESGPVLIVMEGLSMYLPEKELRELVIAMAGRFPGGMLAVESLSRGMVARSHRMDMNGCGVAYTWGMDGGEELASWSPRITFAGEFPYIYEEPRRWGVFALLSWLPMARKTAKISVFRFVKE